MESNTCYSLFKLSPMKTEIVYTYNRFSKGILESGCLIIANKGLKPDTFSKDVQLFKAYAYIVCLNSLILLVLDLANNVLKFAI